MATDLRQLEKDFFQVLKKRGRSINTLKNYRTDLNCFNDYLQKQKDSLSIEELDPSLLENYGPYLDERYTCHNSRRRRLQSLRIFFDFLVAKGHYLENVARALPTSPKFLDHPRPTPLAHLKILWQHLLQEIRQEGNTLAGLVAKRNGIIFLLTYGAGLKVSDISALTFNRINIKSRPPRVLLCPPKRDPHSVPLPDVFAPFFTSYRQALQMFNRPTDGSILFNANSHAILSCGLGNRGIELVCQGLRKKLDIILTPKSLRQACVFKWLCQQVPVPTIKEWLGLAPSHRLDAYQERLESHLYNDSFLQETFVSGDQKGGKLLH